MYESYLRNRSALAVNIGTTDRQTVNYYTTIHAPELVYFDFNNDENIFEVFIVFQLSAIELKKSRQ